MDLGFVEPYDPVVPKRKKKLVLEFEKSKTFLFTCIGTARGGEELGETILIFAGPVKNEKK